MSTAQFSVAYVGPGVEDGTMSVRQLAPALLEIGSVIEAANRVLNGDAASVSVRIRPATREGSAIIELLMQFDWAEQIAAFIGGGDTMDAQELLALIGFLDPEGEVADRISSVIEWIKLLRGREVTSSTTYDDGSMSIEVRENNGEINVYNIDGDVVMLSNSDGVRKSLSGVMDPLDDPRIEEFQVRNPAEVGEVIERVTKEERREFRRFREDLNDVGERETGEFTDWVTVRKAWTVEPTRKWQFASSRGGPFNAVILDEAFWERMGGDHYVVTPHAKFHMRITWEQIGDNDPEYTVVEVLDYKPAEPQAEGFDFPADETPNEGDGE